MACDNQFRHVCLKDLENYIKRDEYFSDFSDEEKAIIKKNLGITTSGESSEYDPIVHLLTYDTVYKKQNAKELQVGHIYVIQDFQTIYLDDYGGICGLEEPTLSTTYWLFLHPTSNCTFDKRVGIFEPGNKDSNCSKWTVEYDITRKKLENNVYNKGTIIYLKDQNNNEAHYDFKNMKFKKTVAELKNFPKSYTQDMYFYTFDNSGMDGSEHDWSNNHLGIGCDRNIFLNDTQNVHLDTNVHDNVFADGCKNSHFGYDTYNNIFTQQVYNCSGNVNNASFGGETKGPQFKRIDDFSSKYSITYLDEDTETFQVRMYEK